MSISHCLCFGKSQPQGQTQCTVFPRGLWVRGLERSRVRLSESKKKLKSRSRTLAVRSVAASRQAVVGAGLPRGGEHS